VREPAVARLDLARGGIGTAFATSRHTALTAWHCLRDPDNPAQALDAVELRFLDGTVLAATYEHGDPVEDWAILSLAAPLQESLEPIPLRRGVEAWEDCRCLGFPAATLQDGELGYLPILGTVTGEPVREGASRIAIHAREVAAGLDPAGMSGGPVIPRSGPTEAVGVMSRRLLDYAGTRVGGVLFACPTELFIDKPALTLHAADEPMAEPTLDHLVARAQEGDAAAAAQAGRLLRASGRLDEAERWLRKAAQSHNASGAFELGLLLDPDGKTIRTHPDRADEALLWFRKAATGGDVYGAATLGVRLRQRGRNDAAMPWLEDAVERGDAMAAHTLGLIYSDGGNLEEAERWHRYAAERGDQAAARKMGSIANQRGEQTEALHWLKLAPDDPDAKAELAQLRGTH
jgi:tetratricopeptide (TPR) repeat protein